MAASRDATSAAARDTEQEPARFTDPEYDGVGTPDL
jgi:hypothetical protein